MLHFEAGKWTNFTSVLALAETRMTGREIQRSEPWDEGHGLTLADHEALDHRTV